MYHCFFACDRIFVLHYLVLLVQFWGKQYFPHEFSIFNYRKLTLFNIHFYINFQNATYTHCEVTNLAPSISAAIGSFVPQKYIWQACISLHSAPRFLFLYLYNQLFHERLVVTNLHFCNTVSTKFLIKVIRFIISRLTNTLSKLSKHF